MKKYVLIACLMFLPYAQAANNSQIQSYLGKWAEDNNIVGAAISINGMSYFYGYSNAALKQKVDKNTVFGIGSITKTFVSVVILKLETEGKLNINDKITKYFPKYTKLNNVSIKQLMQMTAGFNDISNIEDISPEQQVELAYKHYNFHQAGQWKYSNASYQLLGLLVEKVTQEPFSKSLSALITGPLALKYTGFPDRNQSLQLKEYQNHSVKTSDFSNLYTAGGMASNVADLSIFINHLFVKKDLLQHEQYIELTTYVETPNKYYKFTGVSAPQFGLGIFQWNIPKVGPVISYPGVVAEGFTSAYTVSKKNIIISQANTYNNDNYTLLWPYQPFTLNLIKYAKIDN